VTSRYFFYVNLNTKFILTKNYYNSVCVSVPYELSTFATWQKCITVSLEKFPYGIHVRKDNSYILGLSRLRIPRSLDFKTSWILRSLRFKISGFLDSRMFMSEFTNLIVKFLWKARNQRCSLFPVL